MGSLEAMAKGSEARYLSDTQNLKIAQVRHSQSLHGHVGYCSSLLSND